MNFSILATALAGLTALPALGTPVQIPNTKFNHATFELSLCWKGTDGKAHSCPIDDVSYIDLVTTPATFTANAVINQTSPRSSAGSLTFVKHEEDHDWWQQCQVAQQAQCKVDLILTFKFSDQFPGSPILETSNGQATNFESAKRKSIKLCDITEISAPASGQGSSGHDGDRDAPKVYVVSFSSLQFLPAPAPGPAGL